MTLAKENNFLALLDQAFFPNFQKLLNAPDPQDAESVFTIVFFLLHKIAEDDENEKEKETKDGENEAWRERVVKIANLLSPSDKESQKPDEKKI